MIDSGDQGCRPCCRTGGVMISALQRVGTARLARDRRCRAIAASDRHENVVHRSQGNSVLTRERRSQVHSAHGDDLAALTKCRKASKTNVIRQLSPAIFGLRYLQVGPRAQLATACGAFTPPMFRPWLCPLRLGARTFGLVFKKESCLRK